MVSLPEELKAYIFSFLSESGVIKLKIVCFEFYHIVWDNIHAWPVTLERYQMKREEIKYIFSRRTNLEHINIRLDNGITDNDLEPLSNLKELKSIRIYECPSILKGTWIGYISKLPYLTEVDISENYVMTDEWVYQLSKLKKLKILKIPKGVFAVNFKDILPNTKIFS